MTKKKDKNKTKRRQPVWRCVQGILKIFMKKPKIVSLSGELPKKAIFVANHSAMFGPVIYNLYLPTPVSPWGAYPMLGNYRSRYHYLRDVYFIQKRHKSKFAATILAGLEALVSQFIYKGMRVIPSYNDTRFIKTIRHSMDELDNDSGVIVFPENSNEGYHELLTDFLAGFVELAKYYKMKHGEDVPIYPIYYHAQKKVMVIGNPSRLTDYTERGLRRKEIAREFCNQVNELFTKYIKDQDGMS